VGESRTQLYPARFGVGRGVLAIEPRTPSHETFPPARSSALAKLRFQVPDRSALKIPLDLANHLHRHDQVEECSCIKVADPKGGISCQTLIVIALQTAYELVSYLAKRCRSWKRFSGRHRFGFTDIFRSFKQ
jgi:hypothetical protein